MADPIELTTADSNTLSAIRAALAGGGDTLPLKSTVAPMACCDFTAPDIVCGGVNFWAAIGGRGISNELYELALAGCDYASPVDRRLLIGGCIGPIQIGPFSTAVGWDATSGTKSVAVGDTATAAMCNVDTVGNTAVGYNATAVGAEAATAVGAASAALGLNSLALGAGVRAVGDDSIAIGGSAGGYDINNYPTGHGSLRIGYGIGDALPYNNRGEISVGAGVVAARMSLRSSGAIALSMPLLATEFYSCMDSCLNVHTLKEFGAIEDQCSFAGGCAWYEQLGPRMLTFAPGTANETVRLVVSDELGVIRYGAVALGTDPNPTATGGGATPTPTAAGLTNDAAWPDALAIFTGSTTGPITYPGAVAIGREAVATGEFSLAVGDYANSTYAACGGGIAHATVVGAFASADACGVSMGTLAAACGDAVAVGHSACADIGGVSVGRMAQASSQSIAIGIDAEAMYGNGVAVGHGASIGGQGAIAIGNMAATASTTAIAIGDNSAVFCADGLALGACANVSGKSGIAIGAAAHVLAEGGLAIGSNAEANFAGFGEIVTGETAFVRDSRISTRPNGLVAMSLPQADLSISACVGVGDLGYENVANPLVLSPRMYTVSLNNAGTALVFHVVTSAGNVRTATLALT